MNYRFLIFSALLLALNLMFNAYPQCSRHDRAPFSELNLTDSQKVQIEQFKLKNQEEMIKLMEQLQLKKLDLEKMEVSGNVNRDNYIAAVNDISAAKNKIAEQMAKHRMDIYSILDETQRKEFLRHHEGPGNKHHRKCFRERN